MTWRDLRLKIADRLCVRPTTVQVHGHCRRKVKIVPPDRHLGECDEIRELTVGLLGPRVEVAVGPVEVGNFTVSNSAD